MQRASKYTEESFIRVLDELDPTQLLSELGVNPALIQEEPGRVKSPCPESIPGGEDTELVVDRESHRLQFSGGPPADGEISGKTLIDLYALTENVPLDDALEHWAQEAGVPIEEQSAAEPGPGEEDLGGAPDFPEYYLLTKYEYEEDEEGELHRRPAPVEWQEQKYEQGAMIPGEQLGQALEENPGDLYRSRYSFEHHDPDRLQEDLERGEAKLYGSYPIAFNATNSSEVVHAINQALEVIETLVNQYAVPERAVAIYYSGRMIEVEVDPGVFGIEPHPELPEIYRRMTEILLDYRESRKDEFEEEWSRLSWEPYSKDSKTPVMGTALTKPEDVHKVRLNVSTFKKTNYVTLYDLAKRPGKFSKREPVTQTREKAHQLYQDALEQLSETDRSGPGDQLTRLFYRLEEEEDVYFRTLHSLAPELIRRFFSEERRLISTPSEHLNYLLGGGIIPGKVYTVGGFPGAGVSTFCNWLMLETARRREAVTLFLTLQRGIEELYLKSLAAIGDIPTDLIDEVRAHPAQLHEDEDFNDAIHSAYDEFQEFNSSISMIEGQGAASFTALEDQAKQLHEISAELDNPAAPLIIIDSLRLFVTGVNAQRDGAGAVDTPMALGNLKNIARQYDVSFLCTYDIFTPQGDLEADRERAVSSFFDQTEFSDMVSILRPLGHELSEFKQRVAERREREALAGENQSLDTLGRLEDTKFGSGGDAEPVHVFSELELLKNTGGILGNVLFLHERNYSRFEPLNYLDLDKERTGSHHEQRG